MKTTTRTEFAVMGLKPDGTWRTLAKTFGNAVSAQQYLVEYINDANRFPDIFTAYAEYKIAKRTVTTTFTDWEEV
jgi:hypothetical protein